MFKRGIVFVLCLSWPFLGQANEIWSARQMNDQSFVRAQWTQHAHSPTAVSRPLRICIHDRGVQTCNTYPQNLTSTGETLFSRTPQAWSQFFIRCRQFDARNNFMLSTQLASIVATGGAG